MGRAARAKQERERQQRLPNRSIRLTPAEYWELRARVADADNAGRLVNQQIARFNEMQQCADALTAATAAKYGFDAKAPYTFDDATLSLVPVARRATTDVPVASEPNVAPKN